MPTSLARGAPVIVAILIASVFTFSNCGSNEGVQPLENETAASAIQLSGIAVQLDGSPLGAMSFDAQVLLIVRSDSAILGNTCPVETQHRASVRVAAEADGKFEINVGPEDFQALSHPTCSIASMSSFHLQALRLNATFVTSSGEKLRADSRVESPERNAVTGNIPEGATLQFSPALETEGSSGQPDLRVDIENVSGSWSIEERSFPADSCAAREGCLSGDGLRRLLVFDGIVANTGDAPLFVGSPTPDTGVSFDSCHLHYHVGGLLAYELISDDGTIVATGRKQGFCLMDAVQVSPGGPGQFTCDYQGISPGWSDVYDRSLDCQWIDITDVDPGNYLLRLTVNPDFDFAEADYGNNQAEFRVNLPASP